MTQYKEVSILPKRDGPHPVILIVINGVNTIIVI